MNEFEIYQVETMLDVIRLQCRLLECAFNGNTSEINSQILKPIDTFSYILIDYL